ncbi:hypothetical protein Taro_050950 [Colocasia esculenta]|uniref:Uncharacterized protein n=1 Tax=Colocasia esculenta TaxID=4460 RepID=A0A843XFH1_COLES|nr:hypothetical protein [Colocasia esculenta]
MADVPMPLYIVVVDEEDNGGARQKVSSSSASISGPASSPTSFRYTRPMLQSTLQLMGCKARHAFKISRRVFELCRTDCLSGNLIHRERYMSKLHPTEKSFAKESGHIVGDNVGEGEMMPFELYKWLTTVPLTREIFLNVVCEALSEYKYVGPNQRADLLLACRIRERKESFTILLSGTSGCGKSTLSALLGNRLGVTTVISTDSIRHMMRSFVNEKQNPLLWASTYHAGDCLDPVAVAMAKARRKEKKLTGPTTLMLEESVDGALYKKADNQVPDTGSSSKLIGQKQMAIEGYKAQSEMVIDSLDRLITAWEDRKESVVVEGVHLSLNFVVGNMYTSFCNHKPVNLQFGNFGISAWPSDTGGTSHTGSMDELRDDVADSEMVRDPLCGREPHTIRHTSYLRWDHIAPKSPTGLWLKESSSVSGIEEAEDQHDTTDSDDDLGDVVHMNLDEEVGNSKDLLFDSWKVLLMRIQLNLTRNMRDLAIRDRLQNVYPSGDDEPEKLPLLCKHWTAQTKVQRRHSHGEFTIP